MSECLFCTDLAKFVCEGCDTAAYCSHECRELDFEMHSRECEIGTKISRRGGHLSRSKAWELVHNPPHGRALTPRQRRYFWAVYHGKNYQEMALNMDDGMKRRERDPTDMPINWNKAALGVTSKEYKQFAANSIIRDELSAALRPGEYFVCLSSTPNALNVIALSRKGKLIKHVFQAESRGPLPLLNAWRVEALGVVPGTLRDAVNWFGMKLQLGRLTQLKLTPEQHWRSERFVRMFPRRVRVQTCFRPEPIGALDVAALQTQLLDTEPVTLEVVRLAPYLEKPLWSRMDDVRPGDSNTLSPAEVLACPAEYQAHWKRILRANLSEPIIVTEGPNGIEVLDGLCRLAHAHLYGIPTIQAKLVDQATLSALKSA